MGEESEARDGHDRGADGSDDADDTPVSDAPVDGDAADETSDSDEETAPAGDDADAIDGDEVDADSDDDSDKIDADSDTDDSDKIDADSGTDDIGDADTDDDVDSADATSTESATDTASDGLSADAGYDPTDFDFDDPEHYSHWIDDVDDEELERSEYYTQPDLTDGESDGSEGGDDPTESDGSEGVDEPAEPSSPSSSGASPSVLASEGAADATTDPADATMGEPAAQDARAAPATADGVAEDLPDDGPSFAFGDDDFEGPESDVEMPLADHIEEMVRRTAVVLVVVVVVMAVVFPTSDDLINFLWNTHIPGAEVIEDRRPRLYGPLELILTELKVAGLAGFVIGLPVFVYETYRFMRPGLYPKERRYYLAAVPTSLVLALVGVAFAHFVVLPAIFAYFTAYTEGTAVIAFGLKETFGLILVLMGYMALVFQIPLFIMLAIMMGLVTREWLTEKRLLFWGGFLGLSFLVSPDPTGMAPIIIAATMITLFEGTLLLLRWTGR